MDKPKPDSPVVHDGGARTKPEPAIDSTQRGGMTSEGAPSAEPLNPDVEGIARERAAQKDSGMLGEG